MAIRAVVLLIVAALPLGVVQCELSARRCSRAVVIGLLGTFADLFRCGSCSGDTGLSRMLRWA